MVATKMIWLSTFGNRVGNSLFRRPQQATAKASLKAKKKNSPLIGILAFETAKTMSRLVSLYESLSDGEIQKLREDVMLSEGVHYLNSVDHGFLLHLACSEKIEDLDRIAHAVSRLGKKCREPTLQGFDSIYSDLKLGILDFSGLAFTPKEIGRKIARMEKLVAATGELYSSLETLSELETSERRMLSWKSFSGPIHVQPAPDSESSLEEKLARQRDNVRRLRENSLWSKSFDKVVALMARAICNVFDRILAVFGPEVARFFQHPPPESDGPRQSSETILVPIVSTSGPLERTWTEKPPINVAAAAATNSGPLTGTKELSFYLGVGYGAPSEMAGGITRRRTAPGSNTLGAAALALRYANVIAVAERLLNNPNSVDDETRGDLYQMLPTGLRAMVREKMRRASRSGDFSDSDESLAEGWREGVGRILGWLAPMAHDTMRWQLERNMERQEFESRPTAMLLQTLFYADREKAEAAIAEVLVGLSCICRHQER